MTSNLVLSTMWAIGRFPSLADFFEAGQTLGFARFELNHGVNSAMLGGARLNGHDIPSLHEPCPADISPRALKGRGWLVSALDERNRRLAVQAVRRSLDLAHELGARQIVVHPGQVDVDPALEQSLRDLYQAGQYASPAYIAVRERLVAARAERAEAHLEAVRRSLVELADYASLLGIRLGLENREHYYEIPLPDELAALLEIGGEDVMGYCHDVGHAQKMENLGFYPHEDWLRRFGERTIEVHLHDVSGLRDHLAVGRGRMDWGMVARYLPAGALRTCEFQPDNSPQEVAAGLARLIALGYGEEI